MGEPRGQPTQPGHQGRLPGRGVIEEQNSPVWLPCNSQSHQGARCSYHIDQMSRMSQQTRSETEACSEDVTAENGGRKCA